MSSYLGIRIVITPAKSSVLTTPPQSAPASHTTFGAGLRTSEAS